ncbi:OmpH family outer membrane protein [Portibacter marinus]|uniref:OmpH family outer membrane protein n=1 Tax=Portibacter marinus TaxID=2898660 RepID=UPI001F25EA55|nr:OmpH family outer membrane protein [Portibacter marinus]
MIKKILVLAAMVITMSFSSNAQRIAIIDVNSILGDMSEYKVAQQEVDKIAAAWRQEIGVEYDKIKSMYNKYQAEQVLLSDEQKTEKENEIMEAEKRVREMQKQKFGPEGDLFKKRQELVQPIQEKVFATIEEFASDRGYDIIFDKAGSAGILFTSDEYDKTLDVKRKLGLK